MVILNGLYANRLLSQRLEPGYACTTRVTLNRLIMATSDPIGIIAGDGGLPALLTQAARAQGRKVVLLSFGDSVPDDFVPGDSVPDDPTFQEDFDGVHHLRSRLGAAVGAMQRMAQMGVRDIVMAGTLKRPSLSEIKPDLATAKVASRLLASAWGDDSLLRRLIVEIEKMGFRVLPVEALLPALSAPLGVLGCINPDVPAERDIVRGWDVATCLGSVDVGQAVVVQQGMVLAVEAIEGTADLLRRCLDYRRQGPGGVLVKISKPGQESRVDMPVIGPDTVRQAAKAGLRGIAIEAERCLIIDCPQTVTIADSEGLFLIGVDGRDIETKKTLSKKPLSMTGSAG